MTTDHDLVTRAPRGQWPAMKDGDVLAVLADAHSHLEGVGKGISAARSYYGDLAALEALLDANASVLGTIISLAQALDHHRLLWPRAPALPITWRRRWEHRIVRRRQEVAR